MGTYDRNQRQDNRRDNRPGERSSGPPEITATVAFKLDAEGEEFENSAFEWAVNWITPGKKLSMTQLRNYYNELLAIYYSAIEVLKNANLKESDLDQKDFLEREENKVIAKKSWEKVELEFKLLKARSAYALRQEKEKRMSMVAFIQSGVKEVDNVIKLRKFKLYFEAAVGHFSYLEKA